MAVTNGFLSALYVSVCGCIWLFSGRRPRLETRGNGEFGRPRLKNRLQICPSQTLT